MSLRNPEDSLNVSPKAAAGRGGVEIYEFGPFRIEVADRRLIRSGVPLPLPRKTFDTLLVLVQNNGHLLTRTELMESIWPDVVVETNNLEQRISALRKILSTNEVPGESLIETVPREGYRFNAEVHQVWNQDDELLLERHVESRLVTTERVEETMTDEAGAAGWLTRPLALTVMTALLVALVGYFAWKSRIRTSSEPPATVPTVAVPALRSIAILPFKTISSAPGEEYLGIGMADTLIAKLSRVRQISVRPVSAVQRYTNLGQDPLVVGRELNVDAVLDGRIQLIDGRIRATVELWSLRDGTRLWTQTLDERRSDIFALQDAIATRVASVLPAELSAEERSLVSRRQTMNSDAYEAYLKGRYFWNRRTRDSFNKAIFHFNQAIAIDPAYAQAYAGLADSYALGGGVSTSEESKKKTREAANKALGLDPTLAEPLAALAYHQGALDWDWEGAEVNFDRAIKLNPNYATARHWHAYNLASMGRLAEAVDEMKRAQELDPLSLIINTDLGHILYFARRYDEAIVQYRKVLELDPNFAIGHWRLGEAYVQKGLYAEAIRALNRARELNREDRRLVAWLGYAYAIAKQPDQANALLNQLERESREDHAYKIAFINAGLDDKEQAFTFLQRAVALRNAEMAPLKVEPMFDSLHNDPRFAQLLTKMNLPAL